MNIVICVPCTYRPEWVPTSLCLSVMLRQQAAPFLWMSPRDLEQPISGSHLLSFAAPQHQRLTTPETVAESGIHVSGAAAAAACSSFSPGPHTPARSAGLLGRLLVCQHGAEEHRGRGETSRPGVALLPDRAPRTGRGPRRHRRGLRAGGFSHLPERPGEAEEGRGRWRWGELRAGGQRRSWDWSEPAGSALLRGVNRYGVSPDRRAFCRSTGAGIHRGARGNWRWLGLRGRRARMQILYPTVC